MRTLRQNSGNRVSKDLKWLEMSKFPCQNFPFIESPLLKTEIHARPYKWQKMFICNYHDEAEPKD